MKFANLSRAILLAAAIAGAGPTAAATLSTPIDEDNGNAGIMFDVVIGASALTLTSFGTVVASSAGDYEFYTIEGSAADNLNNAAAWTLRDTFTSVPGGAPTFFTEFDITDLLLNANTTYGFYITSTGSGGVEYTNATLGDVRASNSDLSIMVGYGKAYPFGGSNAGRAFNGSLTYTLDAAVPEPASWALMIGGFGMVGASLRRRRASFTAA